MCCGIKLLDDDDVDCALIYSLAFLATVVEPAKLKSASASNFVIAEFAKLNFVEFSCVACLRASVKTSCLTGVKSVAVTC